MKKLIIFVALLAFYAGAVAQVKHSYTFAIGNTDGVTLTWDAYSENLEIQGCYLYKRVKYNQPEELISPDLIVSADSAFTFTDTGQFDVLYPPIYSIHIVTPDSIFITDEIYAFHNVHFEVVSNVEVIMEAQAWNNEQCCYMVTAWLDGIFSGQSGYDTIYSFQFLMGKNLVNYGSTWFHFEDINLSVGTYAKLILSFAYIQKLALSVSNNEIAESKLKFSIFPNPATTQAWLQLPENTPLAQVQIELYSPTGRLLYKAQPTSQFHKIDVVHLPKGLYLVRVWDGEKWCAEKLVVR
jgi:hypothetical protein